MKKYLLIMVSLFLLMCFTACSGSSSETANEPNTSDETADISEESTNTEGSDVLVAYFSQTGNTQKIAEYLSEDLNANLFQIIPQQPYTEADIDYNNSNSRSQQEQNDNSARPVIDGTVQDFSKFSYVFLGYPIWNGEAPRIIDTFLESYDFSGKTIVPFCTSASSPIGESATNLEGLAPGADWLEGMRFSADATEQEVEDWANSLNIKK